MKRLDLRTPDRTVPVEYHSPERPGPRPVVLLLSPAFGAAPGQYAGLCGAWTRAGLTCLVVHHPCSGAAAARRARAAGRAREVATAPERHVERAADLRALCDAIREGRLGSGLATAGIGLAGHSMGAATVLAVSGAHLAVAGRVQDIVDDRPRCAVVMSPSPLVGLPDDVAYGRIATPILHVTGTADVSPFGITAPGRRRQVYDGTTPVPGCFLTLTDVGHTDVVRADLTSSSLRLLGEITTLFWKRHLRGERSPWERMRDTIAKCDEVAVWEWR